MSIDLEMSGVDHAPKSSTSVLETGSATRREWRRPVVTRIDIKRTLFFTGSHTDTSTQSPGALT